MDAEFIKFLANSEVTNLEKRMDIATKERMNHQIGPILRKYYHENTRGIKTGWTERFKQFGISEDEGKAAIACARRLGFDIY